jgi:tetratricopeptide (TPR) repeat protein
VQIEDLKALPDVLRAYGRIRDPDAARIVISFCNSERAQIRLAARQGVALMGEVAHWQLRDTYENVIGKRPARDWSWKRTARELFAAFDRQRLAHVHALFEQGLKAKAQGHLETMAKAFDEALARNPMFDRRAEMAEGYVAYALSRPKEGVEQAILALHRAERIVEDPKRADEIRSLGMTLEAERLQQKGIFDRTLVTRALELSANNERAQLLNEKRSFAPGRPDEESRYYGALAILAIALIGIGFILLGRRSHKAAADGPEQEEPKLTDS